MPRLFDRPEDVTRAVEPGDEEPGVFPFTRGIQPAMYRDRLWTMRQYAGYGTAVESNARFRYLLRTGVTGLSVAFDLPTQMGFDSDHAMAAGEVGRVGVAIDSIADMETLFDGIPLDRVSCSMTINATAAILLALYVTVARRRGVSLASNAETLPQGHFYTEPYFFDVISAGDHNPGSSGFYQYGLTDNWTVGVQPFFSFGTQKYNREVAIGDFKLLSQVRLSHFTAEHRVPSVALVTNLVLPTGKIR